MSANNLNQAEIALRNLGFTPSKIKKILQSKKKVTDITLLNEMNENLEMLETAILPENFYSEIDARYSKAIAIAEKEFQTKKNEAEELKEEERKAKDEEALNYKEMVKDVRNGLTIIEGTIRQDMILRNTK